MAEAADSYPVGQAPWETQGAAPAPAAGGTLPDSFPVGQAPWEQQTAKPQEESPTGWRGALDKTARVLDWPGGYVRSAIAGAANDAMNMGMAPPIVTKEDIDNIARGKGPTSSEYLKRMGVPAGPNADLPLVGNVSARGTAGLALDIATDPITAVGKLLKLAPEGTRIITEVLGLGGDATAKAIGESIYKSGFSKIDAKLIEKGSEPLSQLMLEAGAPTGNSAALLEHMHAVSEDMGKARQSLYDEANKLGVTVDMGHPLPKAEEFVDKLVKDKRASVRAQGEALAEYLKSDYKDAGRVDLATLSQWKTDLYNTLPKDFFAPTGKMTPIGKQFNAALASDLKDAIVEGGNAARPGLGDSINHINEKWGPLLEADRPMLKQVGQDAAKAVVSPVDGAVAAIGGPKAFAVKKAADVAGATSVRTNVGKGLMQFGQSGLAGDTARRALIDSQAPDTLGNSVIHGNQGVNAIQRNGQ